MDRTVLLTYKHKDGYCTYDWFESIEDLENYMMNGEGKDVIEEIIECMYCTDPVNIDVNRFNDLLKG